MAVELANLRQLPGLSHRPNFPRDLHVLLLDPDFKGRLEAESQLRECHYAVTTCSCTVEAAAFLANPENSCDVLLANVRCLQQKSYEQTAVVQAAKSIPLVLMSESGTPSEVMLGIKLGAVDFLEKPLSPLKLKNIWQHSGELLIGFALAWAGTDGEYGGIWQLRQKRAYAFYVEQSAFSVILSIERLSTLGPFPKL